MSATPWRLRATSCARLALIVSIALLMGPTSGSAAQPSDSSEEPSSTEVERIANLDWHTDYYTAHRTAKRQRRMLLINFLPSRDSARQRNLEQWISDNKNIQQKLQDMVLARIPQDAEIKTKGRTMPLVKHASFQHLGAGAGLAILDLQHEGQPYYGKVVTALPYASGKYYRWQNNHLRVALDLPSGTISQRTMVWAVRIHPESPASTRGECHPALVEAASRHSDFQARIGVQGHQNWESRYHQVSAAAGAGEAKEVVAESWPNQNLIDSCIDCVASWRHSPGHWGAVRRRHRLFGYDIRRGRNGIWYGTGIFAN